MKTLTIMSTVLGFGLMTASGCQTEQKVDSEIQDLKEARQNTETVANDLQQQLQEAKAEVIRLEEKLALARQGVTDEVMEERQDLKQALKEQEKDVEQEVIQAQREAAEHNVDAQKAQGKLEETVPARVDADLKTDTEVIPGQAQKVGAGQVEETIQVEQTRVDTETEREVEVEDREVVPAPRS